MDKGLLNKLEHVGYYKLGGKESNEVRKEIREIKEVDGSILENLGLEYVKMQEEISREGDGRTLGIKVSDNEVLRGYVDVFKMYTIEEVAKLKLEYEYRMPKEVIPIAEGHDGDYICVDGVNGGVYYWNHEEEYLAINPEKEETDGYRGNMVYIRGSIEDFLEGLEINEEYERELGGTDDVEMTYEDVIEGGAKVTREEYKMMVRVRQEIIQRRE